MKRMQSLRESNGSVAKPETLKNNCGTSSEECVSADRSFVCCLVSRNAEFIERAEHFSVEVSVLSVREGRFPKLYLWWFNKEWSSRFLWY